jgi:hypothetical protein|tara:strand:+ start:652 stop:1227 length:576 start_codon:yes stop_codon:yes gene_type:complete
MAQFQGTPYKELLDKAHSLGLQAIQTEMIHADYETPFYAFKATVSMTSGAIFVGHGEANNNNTSSMIQPHLLRMAETRAIARALRWATNSGETADEEFGGNVSASAPAPEEDIQEAAPPAPAKVAPAKSAVDRLLAAEKRLPVKYGERGELFLNNLRRDYETEDLAFLVERQAQKALDAIIEEAAIWDAEA